LKIEVTGINENDIEVRIENNTLTVQGERKIEKEEKEENFRPLGTAARQLPRPCTAAPSVDPAR